MGLGATHHLIIPRKWPIYKSPADQLMNPFRTSIHNRSGARVGFISCQRRRDDDKNRICGFEGALGAERIIVQNAVFRGKRHDNKILQSQMFIVEKFCCRCTGS